MRASCRCADLTNNTCSGGARLRPDRPEDGQAGRLKGGGDRFEGGGGHEPDHVAVVDGALGHRERLDPLSHIVESGALQES